MKHKHQKETFSCDWCGESVCDLCFVVDSFGNLLCKDDKDQFENQADIEARDMEKMQEMKDLES